MRTLAAVGIVAALAWTACGPDSNPEDPRLRQAQALILNERDFAAAEALLEELLDEFPDTGRAELLLGLALKEEKKYALAIPHFERAIKLGAFEKSEAAWYYLAWARYWQGDLEGAARGVAKYIELDPTEGDAFFLAGLLDLEADRLDSAQVNFERAASLLRAAFEASGGAKDFLQPEIGKAYARLAEVHERRGDPERAALSLREAITVYPPLYTAWFRLHGLLKELGDDEAAAQALEQHDHWKAVVRGNAGE